MAASQALDAWIKLELNPKFVELALSTLAQQLSKNKSIREAGLEWVRFDVFPRNDVIIL